ncbi:MAG TPA: hypothetical protein VFK89_11155 [Actinomycetota bacterium]|nr:hypothetical protein [Actinomycetota bacterium]
MDEPKDPKDCTDGSDETKVPARHSTSDDEATKEEKDAAADHASEQSMDGSDPAAW